MLLAKIPGRGIAEIGLDQGEVNGATATSTFIGLRAPSTAAPRTTRSN